MSTTFDTRRTPAGDFTMAFQPIVDCWRSRVVGYEALARGRNGEGAAHVLGAAAGAERYVVDQACRIKAIALGTRLGMTARLSVNFMPNALSRAETCIRATLRAARHYAFPVRRLVFELTEGERVEDVAHVARVIGECRAQGLKVAIDDFGAGYARLNLLADLHPDIVKLDRGLCRGIDASRTRRAIVHGVMSTCRDLRIVVIAEGIEGLGELRSLRELGVRYFQGYLFARPAVELLPPVRWPAAAG